MNILRQNCRFAAENATNIPDFCRFATLSDDPMRRIEKLNIFSAVGRVVLLLFAATGRLAMFMADAVSHCVRPPVYWKLILQQMLRVGYFSLPVVGLTAFFTGAVLCLQIFIGGSRYGANPLFRRLSCSESPGNWAR